MYFYVCLILNSNEPMKMSVFNQTKKFLQNDNIIIKKMTVKFFKVIILHILVSSTVFASFIFNLLIRKTKTILN